MNVYRSWDMVKREGIRILRIITLDTIQASILYKYNVYSGPSSARH